MQKTTIDDLLKDSQMEQAEAGIGNIARLVGFFYRELQAQGVDEGTICALTRDWMRVIIENAKANA